MRARGRIDANHKTLREFVRAHGVRWLDLANVGNGCPDALVCGPYRDHLGGARMILVEVKDGAKVKSARTLTPDQRAFHDHWPVWMITNEQDAGQLIHWLKAQPDQGREG